MRWLILFLTVFLSSCGSEGQGRHGTFRIGIDPTWSPIDFKDQQPYVNGYVEDLLLEISRYSGVAFEKIPANWDSLFDGLKEERYDAVFSSLPPYAFNLAKYDFSKNFLDIGPVLVTAWSAHISKLDQIPEEMVGILTGDPAALILEQHPTIIIRSYNSIPEMLDAILGGQIQAALLNCLPASSYTRDLYAGRLKIASAPLTDAGLHAVCLKKNPDRFIRAFNNALEHMKKKKTSETLQKKWNLS